MLQATVDSFESRLHACIAENGHHLIQKVQHVIFVINVIFCLEFNFEKSACTYCTIMLLKKDFGKPVFQQIKSKLVCNFVLTLHYALRKALLVLFLKIQCARNFSI